VRGKKKKKKRERKKRNRGDKVKNKVAGEQRANSETFSYYTGDTLEMEQEIRACERGDDGISDSYKAKTQTFVQLQLV